MHLPPLREGSKEGNATQRRESFRDIPHLGLPHPAPAARSTEQLEIRAWCLPAMKYLLPKGLTMDLYLAGAQPSRNSYCSLFAWISLSYLLTEFDIKLLKKIGKVGM